MSRINNQENLDSNFYKSNSKYNSRKINRISAKKAAENHQEQQEEIQEFADIEQLKELEEERLRKEAEEAERKKEEILKNRELGLEKLLAFSLLKKINLITSSFNSVKCSANKIKIQECFADELCTLNLKRNFLLNFKEAAEKSKFRFKLMRNFARILRLNLRERIRVKQRSALNKIKKIKPKPFHRTNKRINRRRTSRKKLKQDPTDKGKSKNMERLEKIKNNKLKQVKKEQKSQPRVKHNKTSRNGKERPSKSPNVARNGCKTSRNLRQRRQVNKTKKLNKKSKSTLELNKKSKSTVQLGKSQHMQSMEKNIVFDNSKKRNPQEKKLVNSKSSYSVKKTPKSAIAKQNHVRTKSKKIPKLEGFGSVSKVKRSSRNFVAEINSKNGEDFGKSFDLFEQSSNKPKDYKLDVFGLKKKPQKESVTDRAQRSYRRPKKREICGDELESISIDLRKFFFEKFFNFFFQQNLCAKNPPLQGN